MSLQYGIKINTTRSIDEIEGLLEKCCPDEWNMKMVGIASSLQHKSLLSTLKQQQIGMPLSQLIRTSNDVVHYIRTIWVPRCSA